MSKTLVKTVKPQQQMTLKELTHESIRKSISRQKQEVNMKGNTQRKARTKVKQDENQVFCN